MDYPMSFLNNLQIAVRQFRQCKSIKAMSNDRAISEAKIIGIKIIDAEPTTLAFQAWRKCVIRAALALELQDVDIFSQATKLGNILASEPAEEEVNRIVAMQRMWR
jgi:hypothetical protein